MGYSVSLQTIGVQFQRSHLQDFDLASGLAILFMADMLQCAGLALIIMSFVDRHIRSGLVYGGITVTFIFISPLLWEQITVLDAKSFNHISS
ncbi:MAG: hypothetical protein ACFFD4_10445 [Candidatus Odinarchaeota archaeon]